MFRKINKAQSTAEYAVVLSVVIAAIIGMQIYVKRGLSARVKAGTDAFTSAGAGFQFDAPSNATGTGFDNITFGKLTQYEPYYAESSYDTYSENVEQEHMGNGTIAKEKVSDINIRREGGYQAQRGSENATERENIWKDAFGK